MGHQVEDPRNRPSLRQHQIIPRQQEEQGQGQGQEQGQEQEKQPIAERFKCEEIKYYGLRVCIIVIV